MLIFQDWVEFQDTFSKINNLNQELITEGKCILCSRSCSCHLPQEQLTQRHFKKSAQSIASPTPKPETIKQATKIMQPKTNTPVKSSPVTSLDSDVFKENVEKIKPKHAKLKSLNDVKLSSWRSVVKEKLLN